MNNNVSQQIMASHAHLVLFDGVCNLCSGWVLFLIKRDPCAEISFCAVQTEQGKALLKSIGLATDEIETMAYIRHGEVFLRSTAFLEMTKKLPAAWPCLSVALYLPKRVRDCLYNLIARNRYRIAGKKQHCLIPSDELKSRFIEWNTDYRES